VLEGNKAPLSSRGSGGSPVSRARVSVSREAKAAWSLEVEAPASLLRLCLCVALEARPLSPEGYYVLRRRSHVMRR
jgi:hypothetical protein